MPGGEPTLSDGAGGCGESYLCLACGPYDMEMSLYCIPPTLNGVERTVPTWDFSPTLNVAVIRTEALAFTEALAVPRERPSPVLCCWIPTRSDAKDDGNQRRSDGSHHHSNSHCRAS